MVTQTCIFLQGLELYESLRTVYWEEKPLWNRACLHLQLWAEINGDCAALRLIFSSVQTSTVSPVAGTLNEGRDLSFTGIAISTATPAILPGVLQSPCSSTATAKKNDPTTGKNKFNLAERCCVWCFFCVASSIEMPLKSKPLGRVPVVQWCLTASFLFASSPSISPQGRLTLSMTELFFIPRQSGSSSATIIRRSSTQRTRGGVSQVLFNYGKDRKGDN